MDIDNVNDMNILIYNIKPLHIHNNIIQQQIILICEIIH